MKTYQPVPQSKEAQGQKYILMMNGTKANFVEYAKFSKKDMEANDYLLTQAARLSTELRLINEQD